MSTPSELTDLQSEIAEFRNLLREVKEVRALRRLRQKQLELKCELAALAVKDVFARYFEQCRKAGFNPNQLRVPAGNSDGGQWTSEGDGGARVRLADAGRLASPVMSDATDPIILGAQYAAEGHHFQAQQNYRNLPLSPETRKIFDDATSGRIHIRGHFFDEQHRQYNRATDEVMKNYMNRHGITPEQMTPNQAREIVKEIRESSDPRIRRYNEMIRFLQRMYRLRSGSE
jgi:hypothetical protein